MITDLRVIDVDQHGFFDRIVTEATYPHMEEVTYRIKGMLATIFRYGTVRIRIAGDAADIEVSAAKNPSKIQDLLNDLRKTHVENH